MDGTESPPAGGLWKVGQVAQLSGVSVRTLHHYDALGLVRPTVRTAGGHRAYSRPDVERLYRVCVLRRLGRPLAEIADLLDGDAPLGDTVDAHLSDLDAQLAALCRQRERVLAAKVALDDTATIDDRIVIGLLDGLATTDAGVRQRIALLVYDDVATAHDWLVAVFGFGAGTISRDAAGEAVHAELHVGDGVVWLHPSSPAHRLASPESLGVSTVGMAVMVDDLDQHHARVVAAGGEVVAAPRPMAYGVREYDVRDCEGHLWSFMEPIDSNEGAPR